MTMSAAESLRATALGIDNQADRLFDVFFYGLNMDADLLASRGVVPRFARAAHIENYRVQLGSKAMLLRFPCDRARGMLFKLTHAEMDRLYAGLSEYRPEGFLAVCAEGQVVPAVSMVHIDPPLDSEPDPAYAARWGRLVFQLGIEGDESKSRSTEADKRGLG